MEFVPDMIATRRSKPTAIPAWGGAPYLRAQSLSEIGKLEVSQEKCLKGKFKS
jgi:hypothetical protein